jgi:TonB family protein
MKRTLIHVTLALALLPAVAAAGSEPMEDEVLLLRHALLVGGRDVSQVPIAGEARSAEELAHHLAEWEPGKETEEIRALFALEGLSEVVRQALVLPVTGGQSNSLYAHDGVGFEVRFDVQPEEDGSVATGVEIRRDGAWLAGPTVTARLGERAIVSTTNGPEAPFLFLVVEVDRVSQESVRHRGLKYAWRDDLMTVDGKSVTAPRATHKEPPRYTEKARQERIQGLVILRLVIDETGGVTEVDVLKGLPHGLTESAIETVERWEFEPARHDGKPVSVIYNITINFRLQKGKKPEAEEPAA